MNIKSKEIKKSQSTAGFVLPTVAGIGFLALLIVVAVVTKSTDGRTASILSKQASNAQSIAEGGAERTLGSLNNNYQSFLNLNYDPNGILGAAIDEWSSPPSESVAPCTEDGIPNGLLSGKIPTSADSDTYFVEAYRYDNPDGIDDTGDETGTLLVKGQFPNLTAVSRIQQTVNIEEQKGISPFPGLLATDINLGNNDVLGSSAANVICTNTGKCPVENSACVNNEPTFNGLRDAIGAGRNALIDGEIYIGSVQMPAVPVPPVSGVIDDNRKKGIVVDGKLSNQRFPRDGDKPAADGIYHYLIDSISLNNQTVVVDSSTGPVYFYVNRDITMSGNAVIQHVCAIGSGNNCGSIGERNTVSPTTIQIDDINYHLGSPARFRIYGTAEDGNDTYNQSFRLNGGATPTNVFIFAPDARVEINGGPSSPDIRGAVWAFQWDGSNANNADLNVPIEMQNLLESSLLVTTISNRTSAATSWSRRSF